MSLFAADVSVDNLKKLLEAERAVSRFYVDRVSDSSLVDYAISGMLQQLDPHSVYIPKSEMQKINEPLVGNFEGIGVQFIMLQDTLYVESVIPGGPSEKVGILSGDRFIKVNDSVIAGVRKSSTDIMKIIRGKKGTKVNICVVRSGLKNPIDFTIVRDKIPLHSIQAAYMIAPSIGYIKLSVFSSNTKSEFDAALAKLKAQGMKDLIFDLQGNGGGYLNAATSIADEFLDGNQMIVYTKGRVARENFKSKKGGDFTSGRIVFLVDESSASASEILAGAMQDNDRAVIVGRRTFGKGLVQMPMTLSDGSGIRLTIARYYTPSDRCIQKPYKHGLKKYRQDVIDRYNHGELLSADSIHFPDSLKYQTLNLHRTVYGGGGIMPDYFVPIDTTVTSAYLTKIISRGTLLEYSSECLNRNERNWKSQYKDVDSFSSGFVVSDEILDGLVEKASENKIEYNEEQYHKSLPLIKSSLKSIFARRLFGNEAFYQVYNLSDHSCQKALEILTSEGMYNGILHKGAK